jgi:TonB-dependent SusC/RagA subfamily outer membrane receptor
VQTNVIEAVPAKEPLYIVDGEIMEQGKGIKSVAANTIKEVNVIRGADALALYGEQAKNGVIMVKTKALYEVATEVKVEVKPVVSVSAIKNLADFKGLIIVDGVETSKANISKIAPEAIQSMDVLKGEAATMKYKDKGKEGVIVVTTKSQ